MSLIRTFLAIEVDAPTRTYMATQVAALRPLLPSVPFVAADTWHLTLAFLGDLTDEQVEVAGITAEAAASMTAPFTLHIAGLGTFGEAAAPRVIWLGVEGMVAELRVAQGRLRAALDGAGLGSDGHFSPHLTLARLRHPLPTEEAEALRMALAQPGAGPDFTTAHIAVMRSDRTPTGAHYTVMARAALIGA